jgi:predicted dehydrogenase
MDTGVLRVTMTATLLGIGASGSAAEAARPVRLGVVGYEGHGAVFTDELSAGLGSRIGLTVSHLWHKAPIAEPTRQKLGVEVVAAPAEMIGKVDGVFIAEELPQRYRELAEPFVRAGVRTFLNRPLAGSAADAAALIALGRECGNPVFAASLLAVDPAVLAARREVATFAPIKVANVTGPSNHFWWYVPHALSILVTVLGPGVEEIQTHDFEWDQPGVTFRGPLVIFFRYAADSPAGPARGTIQVVPGTQAGDWYGFRLKLYGHAESPEYQFMKPEPGTSVWLPLYQAMLAFFRDGAIPFSDRELLEVPLVLDMVLKSGTGKRPVLRSEYSACLELVK